MREDFGARSHGNGSARPGGNDRARPGERGMVTAETALVTPFLLALMFTLVFACAVAITQVRLVDAAREGARMAARGDQRDAVEDGVRVMVPRDTTLTIEEGADSTTRVTVRHRARIDLPLVRRFSVGLEATAVSIDEAADASR